MIRGPEISVLENPYQRQNDKTNTEDTYTYKQDKIYANQQQDVVNHNNRGCQGSNNGEEVRRGELKLNMQISQLSVKALKPCKRK